MASTFLSRIIGLVRVKYIVWLFGSGMAADALNGAFVLPDMISYFLVGGAASITFVTILTRYRETGREAEGERSLSVIVTTMLLVLGTAIVLAEIFAPFYIHWWFNGFDAEKAALCVHLTRILLPAQLCFFAGGVFGAVLLVRKQFSVQAVAPLIYGLGTIVGGVLLVGKMGVSSLAVGTVAGAFFGPFLLNYIFARRNGTRYRPILDWHDAGLREWVRLSLPLMVGVSLVTADNWIIAHFASGTSGAVSLMSYAKQLFTAPMAVLAQAAGAASMPFFASLWSQQRRFDFATHVADSVSRVAALALLGASGMVALAAPLVELLLLGGRFSSADSRECAAYFAVFSVSRFLCFLCSRQHLHPHGRRNRGHAGLMAHVRSALPCARSHGAGHRFQPRYYAPNRNHRRAASPTPHGFAGQLGLRRAGPLPAGGSGQRRGCLDGALGNEQPGASPVEREFRPAFVHPTALDRPGVPADRIGALGPADQDHPRKNRLRPATRHDEAAGAGLGHRKTQKPPPVQRLLCSKFLPPNLTLEPAWALPSREPPPCLPACECRCRP
jgi:murein biosynthesis integral membrane protein MurJ